MKRISLICFVVLTLVMGVSAMSQPAEKKSSDEESQGCFIGIFREGAPAQMFKIRAYEEKTGKKPAMIMWYQDWEQPFPLLSLKNVDEYGAVPHIVWEPWYWSDHNKVTLDDIIAGKWDSYIDSWAAGAKNYGKPIFIRLAHEFNIEGYPWGIINNKRDAQKYIEAYRRVVDVFKKKQADNVKWIWCFMNYSHPDEPWNEWSRAYPGDGYVDWVGIDGYNWGTTQSWSDWQDFSILFRSQMREVKRLYPDKPIMVAEFASAEKGGSKADWIRQLPEFLKSSMKDINAILWFDVKKETDWRIESSSDSLAAYKEIMRDPFFISSSESLMTFVPNKYIAGVRDKKTVLARYISAPPAMDKTLRGIDKSAPVVMADASYVKEGLSWGGPSDLSGRIYFNWDENNFYVAGEVSDNLPLMNTKQKQNVWNGDALEITMSTKPGSDPKRTSFGSGDYQIGLGMGDDGANQPSIWIWQRRMEAKGAAIVVSRVSGGYEFVASIPWNNFKNFAPEKGMEVGFDLALDDADAAKIRERQMIWNGDFYFYKDPSVWGKLRFD